jgi:Cof subfamily protein (haloacid dehalogenase superfamily)
MKLLQHKLIVTDLDGTLVKSGTNEISQATIDVIKALKKQGIFFTIATGRSWKQTQVIAQMLQITIPVIVQAGAIIIDPFTDKVMRVKPLQMELEKKLRQICDSPEADLFCLNETGVYFTTQINTKGGDSLLNRFDESCKIGKPEDSPTTVIKHLYIGPEHVLKQLAQKINQEIKPRPNLILWPPDPGVDDYFLEVFDPLASKGQAVKWLADYLTIEREQVIAFGDGHNDLDMLQWAGLGVTIEGAHQTITSQANMMIPKPDLDGIARFLKGEFQIDHDKSWLETTKRREA